VIARVMPDGRREEPMLPPSRPAFTPPLQIVTSDRGRE
jgi:hypothetical protein